MELLNGVHLFTATLYAREELRAEIASLVLGSELGIGYDPGQHASYVDSWSRILQDKPLEILSAAAAAEKISDYVLTIEQKQEIRREVVLAGHPKLTTRSSRCSINLWSRGS